MITMFVAAAGAASWLAYDYYRDSHVTLMFANGKQPVPSLELTFYPEQLAFTSPSPPPAIGAQRIENEVSIVVGDDFVPGRGVVRYRGEGVGTGFAYVKLGQKPSTIQLRAPQSLRGRIGEPIGYWFMGWRCAGIRPVANAEVVIMGGGEHGVDLATTRTDVEGRFTLTGFDGELDALGLRVRAPGFVIVHEHVDNLDQHTGERAIIALTPADPRRGKLEVADGIDVSNLRLLARGLPGADTVAAVDGSFTLDHIPNDLEARIVVHGMRDNWAQTPARTKRGKVTTVSVVVGATLEGRVFDRQQQPVPGALVWVGDGSPVWADSRGKYRLVQVLPGDVTVTAQLQTGRGSRARTTLGIRSVKLEPRRHHTDIDITLKR
ncbi:MAG: hypothetical protein ACI91B_004321 [Planctomycetota bacterium]|jgi:hypothetical protein